MFDLNMFSQTGNNTILLTPPASNKESEPIYHISWTEDYFLLGNLITTVRRGGTAEGQLVHDPAGVSLARHDSRTCQDAIGEVLEQPRP